jgi:hypothetical protein
MSRRIVPICLCICVMGSAILSGCAKPAPPASLSEISSQAAQPTEVKAESPQAAASAPARAETVKPAPPKPTEVRETLQRMFSKAVVIDESRNPYFVVGDFNGDGSQDLAIVVKPAAGMLSQINSEVANWVILDPQKTVAPDLKKGATVPQKSLPVNIAQTDVLLAVIHGYGPTGWRSRETTQAFLLKRAVGSAMQARSLKEALQAAKIESRRAVPQVDVITETIDSESGFLIWIGAKYAWYRPTAAADTLAQIN